MRASTKIWLLTAAALVLIGLLCMGYVLLQNHGGNSPFGTVSLITDTVKIEEDFRSMDIRSDTEEIRLVPTEDGTCSVRFYLPQDIQHTAVVEDETLVIKIEDKREWLDQIGSVSFDTPGITVYLPKTDYADLRIEESTGDIEIPKDFSFENVDITASTGSVVTSASVSGTMRIALSTGDIHLEDLSAGQLELSVSTGAVQLRSVSCLGSLGIGVSTGKTTLTDVDCGSLRSTGSTGALNLTNVLAVDAVRIERSTGDVQFAACDAKELYVKTDTGDVTGSLLSSKVFLTKSDTGKIEVPQSVTGGRCEITTDTGDIRLEVLP